MNHFKKSLLTLGCLAAIQAQAAEFAYTSFEEPSTGSQYMDTGDQATDHALVNNAGQASVNYTSTGNELGFSAFYSNTQGSVGLTDGDFFGVTAFTGTVGSYTDGIQGYQLSDVDGKVTLTFDSVDISNQTNVSVSLDYFVQATGWEITDSIRIWLVVDGGLTEINLIDTTGNDIDSLNIEGAWKNLSANINGTSSAVLKIELESNSGNEAIFIDNIVFDGDASGTTPTTADYTPGTLLTSDNSDASTAIDLGNGYIVVGDDEASELRVYPKSGGDAVASWSYDTDLGLSGDELDLEASAKIGNSYYFTGSHSNKSNGNDEPSREYIFAVTIDTSGATPNFAFQGSYSNLVTDLDSSYAAYGFGTSADDGVPPESKSGFSIEGMTATTGGGLLLGFRAPQADTNSRDKAIVVTLSDVGNINSSTTPTISGIQELELGGRGIRSMYTRTDGTYLLIAGPSGSANADVGNDFVFFTWDGTNAPVQLDNDLDALLTETRGSFETIVDVDSTDLVHLLQDNGDTVWTGETDKSKKLDADKQKFVGNWVQLGGVISDADAPMLVKSLPADGAVDIGTDTVISLTFDEYVKVGTGDFTITDGSASINVDVATVEINGGVVTFSVPGLVENTQYTVTAPAGILKDSFNNDWAGITGSDYMFTTFDSNVMPSYDLLISEVNSKATGEDFFELYNYGSTDIDISGWKWYDKDLDEAKKQVFPAGTVVKAGKTLVVAVTDNENIFRNAWGANLDANQPIVAISEDPGLGKGDAVVMFNNAGQFVTGMNYHTGPVSYTGGALDAASGVTVASKHAGEAVGGADSNVSAVWDGNSHDMPNYVAAVDGTDGAWAQADGVGSPGQVTDNVVSFTKIHAIQGTADANAMNGQIVTIQGIVVGDFQNGDTDEKRNLGGIYVQEEDADVDVDALTSEGIFIYEGSGSTATDVNVGDQVIVKGTVAEFRNQTQLKDVTITFVSSGNALPTAATVNLPTASVTGSNGRYSPDLEAYEGMLVTFPEKLTITEMYNLDRYGEIKLSQGGRLKQFTQDNAPDVSGFDAHLMANAKRTITYEDGLTGQNQPLDFDGFDNFSTASDIRMGDSITGLTGVLTYGFNNWRVRSKKNGDVSFTKGNERPTSVPNVGGTLKVASFNVENYFTTLDALNDGRGSDNNSDDDVCGPIGNKQDCRGADSYNEVVKGTDQVKGEFARQREKTITAISMLDAGVLGLMELENTPDPDTQDNAAIADLVNGLNDALGAGTYAYVESGMVGSDVIRVGVIYKPAKVKIADGTTIASLDDSNLPNNFSTPLFDDENTNRSPMAVTLEDIASGEQFTLAVTHMKSKGGNGSGADADKGDGAGNWNDRRTKGVEALLAWLDTRPTGTTSDNIIVLGDMNAYAMEDPIAALKDNGYTDLIATLATPENKSLKIANGNRITPRRFVFDAQLGKLDYIFANAALKDKVTGAAEWHVNADEPDALDYNLDYDRSAAIFNGTQPWRTSDHDPIIIGLEFTTPVQGVIFSDSFE